MSCPVCREGVADLPAHLELHTKQEVVLALLTHQRTGAASDGRALVEVASQPGSSQSVCPSLRGQAPSLYIRKTLNNVNIVNNISASSLPLSAANLSSPAGANITFANAGGLSNGAATPLVIPSPAASAALQIGEPLSLLCSSAASGSFFPVNLLPGLTSTPLLLPQVNGPTLLVNVPTNYVTFHHHHHHHHQQQQQLAAPGPGSGGDGAALVLSTGTGMFAATGISPFHASAPHHHLMTQSSLAVSSAVTVPISAGVVVTSNGSSSSSSSSSSGTLLLSSPGGTVVDSSQRVARSSTSEQENEQDTTETVLEGPSACQEKEAEPQKETLARAASLNIPPPGPSGFIANAISGSSLHHAETAPSVDRRKTCRSYAERLRDDADSREELAQPEAAHHRSVISRAEVLPPAIAFSQNSPPPRSGSTASSGQLPQPNVTFPHLFPSDSGESAGTAGGGRAYISSSVIVSPSWAGTSQGAGDPFNTTTVR